MSELNLPPPIDGVPPSATSGKKPNGEAPGEPQPVVSTAKSADSAPEDIFDDIESLRKVAELKVQRRVVAVNMESASRQTMDTSSATQTRRSASMRAWCTTRKSATFTSFTRT